MEMFYQTSLEKRHESLKLRLIKAAENTKKKRRKIIKTDFGPLPYDSNLTKFDSEELFVILAERIFQSITVISEPVAKKLLIKASQTADALEETARGNDALGKFFTESIRYLDKVNPTMADDIQRLMEAASIRAQNRADRRDDFYRRWSANQK